MMRLLLLSLFSLLLFTLVSSHPRARGIRLGKPFPQVQREKDGSKSDDEKVGSMSDDVGLEKESHSQDSSMAMDNKTETSGVNESIAKLPISAMLRRRKHECESKSEEKSHSNDKSHYESKLKDIEEWLEMAKENCGVEMKMEDIIKKVYPDDVRRILNSAAWTTEQIAKEFSRHRNNIAELEINMAGQSLQQTVSAHITVLYEFGSLVETASNREQCDFISMQMLLDRIEFLGSEGFVDFRCNKAYRMVFAFGDDEMDEYQPVKLYWLYKFGEAIRSDMTCIIDDITGLSQHISELRNLSENNAPPPLRDIHIGLSTIMAYEGILGDEIDQFHRAIEVVGKALENTDLQALEADGMMYSRKRKIYNTMKKLLLRMA